MDGEIFLDSDSLREHAEQLRDEEKCARQLYDVLYTLKLTVLPEFETPCERLMREIRDMELYYGAMADTIENLGDDTELLSIRIRHMLQDNLDSNPLRTIFRDV